MTRTESSDPNPLFELLVAYRLIVYFGGLVLIALPLVLEALEIGFPATARVVIVAVVLTLMVLTYLGERRVGFGESETTGTSYPLRTRLALAFALVGIAVGVYVTLEVSTLAGLLFIAGAYLFGYMGYRSGFDGEGE